MNNYRYTTLTDLFWDARKNKVMDISEEEYKKLFYDLMSIDGIDRTVTGSKVTYGFIWGQEFQFKIK